MRKRFVNRNFFYTLEERNGRCFVCENDTELNDAVIDSLEAMVENKSMTILDMKRIVLPLLPDRKVPYFNYLAPKQYSDECYDDILYITPPTDAEYEANLDRCRCERLKSYEAECKQLFGEKWRVKFDKNKNFETEIAIAEYAKKAKADYFQGIRRYLYAWYYHEALKRYRILERLGSDVKMYSTEIHGWNARQYPINEKVEIKLLTNFAYRNSSYFKVVLIYEGIPIVPYSFYVIYYYAHARDVLAATRSYRLLRECWKPALEFVRDAANFAMDDPERFAKEWIMGEVGKLIAGLEEIMHNPKRAMGRWLDANPDPETAYIRIRNLSDAERKVYACYPEEMLIEFKAAKIAFSLDFVESLKALKTIYDKVDDVVSQIRLLVNGVQPEIEEAIEKIQCQLQWLSRLQAAWKRRHDILSARVLGFEHRKSAFVQDHVLVCKGLDRRSLAEIRYEAAILYSAKTPEYAQCKSAVEWCAERLRQLKSEEEQRTEFLGSFKTSLQKIRKEEDR